MAKSELVFGELSGGANLASPDLEDNKVYSANSSENISVTKKPRYIVLSASLISSGSNNLVLTCCDRDNNASRSIAISTSGTGVEYDTVGMKTDDALGGLGVTSVTDSVVTVHAHPSIATKMAYMIYY